MKIRTTIFLSLMLGFMSWVQARSTDVPGAIEKISDGDTVWVDPKGGGAKAPKDRLKIRMIEMDAPETHLPTPSSGVVGQGHWGDKATEFLAALTPKGTRVVVEDHGLDKYKRTLGKVFRGQTDINLQMVKKGWAVTYIICEGKSCYQPFFQDHNVEGYIRACEHAQKNGLGIWDPRDPLEEMPFEFRVRMQEREFEKFVGNYKTKELFEPENYSEVPECQRIFFTRESEARRVGYTLKTRKRFELPLGPSIEID